MGCAQQHRGTSLNWSNDPFGSAPNPFDAHASNLASAFGTSPPPKANTLATLSLAFAFVLAPVGALLGHLGLAQIRRTGQPGRDRAIIGIALSYSVITLTVGALVIWAVTGGAEPPAPTIAAPTDPATLDKQPSTSISAVLDEPTCGKLATITRTVSSDVPGLENVQKQSTAEWTTEQRRLIEADADAFKRAADAAVPLITQTPNMVVRQLYGQYVARGRAYAAAVRNPAPNLDHLVNLRVSVGLIDEAVEALCTAIDTGRPAVFARLVASIDIDSASPQPVDPADPTVLVTVSDDDCGAWANPVDTHMSAQMVERDPAVGNQQADTMLELGRTSANPLTYYFAAYGALYFRIAAVTTSAGPDEQLGYREFGMTMRNFIARTCRPD
ncbi:DUF4190 domain-containing protein [Mycolicibacterium sp. 22603]|uniref:DUF4190 domain-containing protein n=1 Tax=Mycolicibacterium sp. 22603 TaxID=3453950 RepID=UPI003F8759CE